MDNRTALSRRLTELVREVEGVKAVYSSGSTVAAVTGAVGQTLTSNMLGAPGEARAQAAHVALQGENDDMVVSVTIGVSVGASATQVCRTVYDVIAEHFIQSGASEPGRISVRVGRIG